MLTISLSPCKPKSVSLRTNLLSTTQLEDFRFPWKLISEAWMKLSPWRQPSKYMQRYLNLDSWTSPQRSKSKEKILVLRVWQMPLMQLIFGSDLFCKYFPNNLFQFILKAFLDYVIYEGIFKVPIKIYILLQNILKQELDVSNTREKARIKLSSWCNSAVLFGRKRWRNALIWLEFRKLQHSKFANHTKFTRLKSKVLLERGAVH